MKNAIKNHITYQDKSLHEGILRSDRNEWGDNYFTSLHNNKSGSDVRIHHIYVDVRDK